MEIDWIIKGLLNSVKSTSVVAPSSIINKQPVFYHIKRQSMHEAKHLSTQFHAIWTFNPKDRIVAELNYSSESFTCFLIILFLLLVIWCISNWLVYWLYFVIRKIQNYIRMAHIYIIHTLNMTIRPMRMVSSNQFKCFHVNAECFCGRNVTLFTLMYTYIYCSNFWIGRKDVTTTTTISTAKKRI